MDKEEFIKKIQEIGGCEDEVQRRTLLAEVNDEVSKVYDERDTLSATNQKQTEDMETLRKANMDLFLRVGSQKTDVDANKDLTGINSEPPKEKRKFEDLFDEKGGIK